MAKAKPIENEEDLKKYLARELKKIRKVWLHYCDVTDCVMANKAYLSLTVFRDCIMFNNDPESSKYFNVYEGVENEESTKEN